MPPPPSHRPRPALRRRLAWGLAALLAVRALLPLAIERGAEAVGSERIGRRIEIDDVDLALLAGGVVLEGVAVGPLGRPGEAPPAFEPGEEHFTLTRLAADLGWLGLLGGEIHVERLALDEPDWLMLRDASGQLVPVLLPREEDAPPAESTPDVGDGPVVRLDLLTVRALEASFVNLARPDDLPLHLALEELRLEGLERRGRQLALRGVGLRAPTLRVLRDIDLSFLGEPPAEGASEEGRPPAEAAVAEAAAPPDLRLDEIKLETGRFLLVTAEGEVATRLAVQAEGVTLEPGVTFPLRVTLGVEEGELALEGEAGASPPVFAGTLRWSDLPLGTLGGAAGALSPVQVAAGTSSGELRIDARVAGATGADGGAGDDAGKLGVSGQLGVTGLALRDRDGAFDLGWSRLDVALEELDLDPAGERPPRVALARVTLAEPRVRVVRRAGTAAGEDPAPAAASDQEPAPAGASDAAGAPAAQPEVRLAQLEISGGELEFVDETLKPVHTSKLEGLEASGAGLQWPARRADALTLAFRGPDAARFALDAALREGDGEAHLELSDLALPAFSPYAADASGYWLEDGVLSVEADVAVNGERTKLDSDVDLLRLAVSEVRPGSFEKEFGVPIGLGLALLRDPAGRIGLPIRATLGEQGQSVDLASILLAALRQAIVGALTAPLKTAGLLLGSDDGPGGMRLEPVAMAAGSTEPSAADLRELARFAAVLEERPGLALELHGSMAPDDDPSLAEAILEEQVLADAKLPPVDAGFLQRRRLRGALRERAEGGPGALDADDSAALARWVATVEVPDARREALARARAEAVRDALVADHGVAAGRVQLGDPVEGDPGVVVGLAPSDG